AGGGEPRVQGLQTVEVRARPANVHVAARQTLDGVDGRLARRQDYELADVGEPRSREGGECLPLLGNRQVGRRDVTPPVDERLEQLIVPDGNERHVDFDRLCA